MRSPSPAVTSHAFKLKPSPLLSSPNSPVIPQLLDALDHAAAYAGAIRDNCIEHGNDLTADQLTTIRAHLTRINNAIDNLSI